MIIIIIVLLIVIAIGVLLVSEKGRDVLETGTEYTKRGIGLLLMLGLISGLAFAVFYQMTDGGKSNIIFGSIFSIVGFIVVVVYIMKDIFFSKR